MSTRVLRKKYPPLLVRTPRGRVPLAEWIHVREDYYDDVVGLMHEIVAYDVADDGDADLRRMADKAHNLLKEIP